MPSKLKWRIVRITAGFLFISCLQSYAISGSPNASGFIAGLKVTVSVNKMADKVSGKILNRQGKPVAGVSVTVKGTSIGTTTDNKGEFTIQIETGQTLVFSSIGFENQEILYDSQTLIEVNLEEASTTLNEVVTIGYGTQKKVSLTGSLTTVDKRNLQANPVGNVSDALQGNAPGVDVTTSNLPGSDAKIRIRGLGTINNNNPLWVIDGVPRTGGINEINPADIQSLTVLKDAASTAIYGARGANGVILVTTIQGRKSQAPKVNFDARYGASKNTSRYDLLGVKEYGDMLWLQSTNSGVAPTHPVYGSGAEPKVPKYLLPAGADNVDLSLYNIKSFPITESNPDGTDWYSKVLQPGKTQDYNLSMSGGSKNTTYALTGGMLNEDGIVKLTGFRRYTLSANVNSSVNKWLELGENLRLGYVNNWGNQTEGEDGALGIIPELTAIMPVYDIKGNYAPVSRLTGFDPINNPVGDQERGRDFTRERFLMSGNAHATVSILKNLSFKSLFGFNVAKGNDKSPLEANPDSYQARADNQLTEASHSAIQWNFTNTINYNKKFNDVHTLEVLLGTEAINSTSSDFSATRTKYLLTNSDYWVLNAGEGVQTNTGSASDWSTFSFFGRVHYGFKDRYLFDAVFRRDGSSRFGAQNRYGNFPAFSAAWVASEENFLLHSSDWLNFLKIRASWGKSGNDQIGNYNGFTTFSTSAAASNYPITGSNNSVSSGFQSLAFGNPNAKWETTTTINLGIDATFFKQLDLTVDLWRRNTNDMLYPKGIPSVNGLATVPSVNIGDMKNTGIDLQLTYRSPAANRDLRYSVTMNVSHYKNEIVRLSDVPGETIIGTAYRGTVYTRATAGTSFPEFYGYKVLGIFQTQDEVDKYPAYGTYNAPGRFKFADVNGDGKIDDKDRTYIGNPNPDFTAGFSGNIQYKQFDLNASFYASVGNDIVNVMRRNLDFNWFQRNRSKRRLYESWGSPYLKDNKDAKMPMAELNDGTDMLPSTYFIEDGSFLRLQSLQLGYNLPKKLIGRTSLDRCRIYVMATNLFTITKYSGLDPQVQTSDSEFGIDFGNWPSPKRFLVGLNLSF